MRKSENLQDRSSLFRKEKCFGQSAHELKIGRNLIFEKYGGSEIELKEQLREPRSEVRGFEVYYERISYRRIRVEK